jgi:hypothetical protein
MNLDKEAGAFYGAEDYRSNTMRDICEDIIKPSCFSAGSALGVLMQFI